MPAITTLALGLALAPVSASAAYVRAESIDVSVDAIYANEWGSPFVTFIPAVNTVCSGGRGLYLYNLEAAPNTQLRNNKMALVLTAKATGKKLRLDYFYDSTKTGWEACYIHGLYLID
ncbi:MAG: hypothetical protein JNM97_23395 [Rhodoferax sp.]|nr:hypothetical protein [Rhodoferax sp.]